MRTRDIVVVGGSSGSLTLLKTVLGGLPTAFPGAILIVIHMAEDFAGRIDEYICQGCTLETAQPQDGELIQAGRIYVARPDHHLTVEAGRVRVTRGPRENRHRPAIDPLFRTAARVYGSRVIGIVLSGMDDDGALGLYAVKRRGGVAIVQDPKEAAFDEMPRRALEYASPHYILQTADIAPNLIHLVRSAENATVMPGNGHGKKAVSKTITPVREMTEATRVSPEAEFDKPDENLETAYFDEGEGVPSVFACPECHGVLWELKDKDLARFRCRVGHSYAPESLAKELSHASEAALWAAMRALEEKAAMGRRLADGLKRDPKRAKRLLDQSADDDSSARLIRDMIFNRDAELERTVETKESAPEHAA